MDAANYSAAEVERISASSPSSMLPPESTTATVRPRVSIRPASTAASATAPDIVTGAIAPASVNGVTTRYLLDLNGPMETVLAEMTATNAVKRYYIYGDGLLYSVDGTTGEVFAGSKPILEINKTKKQADNSTV